jgi:hypothetical protein
MLKDRFNLNACYKTDVAPVVSTSSFLEVHKMIKKTYHAYHKSLSLDLVSSQFNVINNFTACVSNIYFSISRPCKLCSLKFYFRFRVFWPTFLRNYNFSQVYHTSRPSHPAQFTTTYTHNCVNFSGCILLSLFYLQIFSSALCSLREII